VINWSVAAYGVVWLYRRGGLSLRTLGGVGWLLVTMIGTILSNVTIAGILYALGGSMSWYANPILIIGLFAVPAIVTGAQFVRYINHFASHPLLSVSFLFLMVVDHNPTDGHHVNVMASKINHVKPLHWNTKKRLSSQPSHFGYYY
jgi:hypothetical protein